MSSSRGFPSKLPDVGTTIFTVMSRRAAELGAVNVGQGFPDYPIDPRLAVNPHTAAGKAIMAVLLAAKAAGGSVRIYGSGTCAVMGNEFESINSVRLL